MPVRVSAFVSLNWVNMVIGSWGTIFLVECHNTEAYMNQTDFISIRFKPILRAPVLIRHLKRMKHCGALYVQDRMDCVGRPGMGKYSAPYGALICVNMTLFQPTLDIKI